MRRRLSRASEVARVRRRLEYESSPRLQMFLIVAITGGAGFLASSLLLRAGMVEMWSRYLAAFGIAYLVFLLLLWLWLRTSAQHYDDPAELLDNSSDMLRVDGDIASTGEGSGFGELLDGADAGEGCLLPLILIAVLAGLLVTVIVVIQGAPLLFAELIVDGLLSASLYRRMRGLESDFWLATALRHTLIPFLLTALLASGAGWWLGAHAPGAHTIGAALQQLRNEEP